MLDAARQKKPYDLRRLQPVRTGHPCASNHRHSASNSASGNRCTCAVNNRRQHRRQGRALGIVQTRQRATAQPARAARDVMKARRRRLERLDTPRGRVVGDD